ncbi:hypothetical protein [Anaerocolumna sp. MB42-C2]|uniref:hypothetical protein n=1 Tax=Anaerocolumna sp. MB42-C2 TaxID=3070997 RepID=UPI0027E1C679|nr:hypothetical protein [Anaerocolumna sp. MB42-C2]WMJ89440.1 hypothetical protein RBU59_07925 [Anaerocolumna sp. MB42-C2]
MDNKIKLLSKLAKREENAIGQVGYEVLKFAAISLMDYMGLEESEYVVLLKELSKEGLIEMYPLQCKDIHSSAIEITDDGLNFLEANRNKKKIGF